MQSLTHIWQAYGTTILTLLKSIILLGFGIYLAFFIRKKIKQFFCNKDEILGHFIAQIAFLGLLILSLITALGTLGIQTTSIITLLGTMGLAIALGLKNSLSNLASGIMLIVLKPFKKDDLIEIGAISGEVKNVNLFQTTLELPSRTQIIIPNETIAKATIINHANETSKKLKWIINLISQNELSEIKHRIQSALNTCDLILQTPQASFKIIALSADSYTLSLQLWINKHSSQDELLQTFLSTLKPYFPSIEITIKD